jgi:3-dehydroquinate dehydratase-1
MLSIENVTLGAQPRIVVAMRDDQDRAAAEAALDAGADILELRLDTYARTETEHCVAHLESLAGLPTLVTIRAEHEGGEWKQTEAERLALFQATLPHASAVDIELSSTAIREDVLTAAREAHCTTIGSFHDFKKTPDLETLEGVIANGKQAGVDIVKIAAFCNNSRDLRRLARLCVNTEDQPLVVIGMGPQSAMSRVFFPALGSLLTYTFLGQPTAPGQMGLSELVEALRRYYGSEA